MKLKVISVLLILMFLCAGITTVSAEQVYQNYTYDYWGNPVEAPETYTPANMYLPADMGTTAFSSPQDLFVEKKTGRIFVADTGNNRIVIFNRNFQFEKEIKELTVDQSKLELTNSQRKDTLLLSETFAKPNGVFVDGNGLIYVADTENKRVVVFRDTGEVVRVLGKPESNVNFTGIDFLPMKVVADDSGYAYLLCKGIYHGAVVYNPSGQFSGYFGANTTESTFELVMENFWRMFYTAEQRAKSKTFVPIEFSNLDIDENGFIYTTTLITTTYTNHIKKFNHKSQNVLLGSTAITSQYQGFYGDLNRVYYMREMFETRFTDICYRNGFIYALDLSRGRVFEYNSTGSLVSLFGGIGKQVGTFTAPVAIDVLDDRILVLDSTKGNITTFRPTAYCEKLHEATNAYDEGFYTESRELWEDILESNSNSQAAYIGIAQALYEEGDYQGAMSYFKQGQDRVGYGKAYKLYRNALLERIIPILIVICAVLGCAFWIIRAVLRRKGKWPERRQKNSNSRWASVRYTLFHPMKGFTDCVEKQSYSIPFSILIALLLFFLTIIQHQYTGFCFNYRDPLKINVLMIFAATVLLLVLWAFGNWAVSTLLDGKGRVKSILYVSSVALVPYLISLVITVIGSNILVTDEGMFITWISLFGILWSGFLMVSGLMVLHDYSFGKTLWSILLTVFLLVVVAFVAVLMFSLFQQTVSFFVDIYNELTFRNLKT